MVFVVAILVASIGANPVVAAADGRVAVSAGAGMSWPSEQAFSDRYGAPHWPLLVQVDVRIVGPFGAFAGLRRETRDGQTIPEAPVVTDERFPLELTSTVVRFGGGASARVGTVDLTASGGAEHVGGTERWPALGQSYDFSGWGFLIQGAVRVPVWWRVAVLGLIEFDRVPIAPATAGAPKVNVGGIGLIGGVSLRF
jgi:hypothetical protein